jgi:hypothetical protein
MQPFMYHTRIHTEVKMTSSEACILIQITYEKGSLEKKKMKISETHVSLTSGNDRHQID